MDYRRYTKTNELHDLWQDPYGLYTTLFVGIDPAEGFFVGADPLLHSPTRFFIAIEFKDAHVEEIFEKQWVSWERSKRARNGLDEPVEVLVGGTADRFLDFVRFELAAQGLDAGHRGLLADKVSELGTFKRPLQNAVATSPVSDDLHRLADEFQLGASEILDLIQSAPRLKMAVRGWVAEAHLQKQLEALPDVTECNRIEEDGQPDLRVSLRGGRPLLIECKNVLRKPYADGSFRLDLQRTRASKRDPCSRYYSQDEFDLVAACLHPQRERWEFVYAISSELDPHLKCPGRLSNLARIDQRWTPDAVAALKNAMRGPT